jgi:hypothetical protein
MDQRAVWLAIAIGMDSGSQVGNVRKIQKKKATKKNTHPVPDYCMKTGHVFFTVMDGAVQRDITGDEDFREFVHGQKDAPQCVVSCKYRFLTGKTKFLETEQTIGCQSPEEITLLDDLVLWFARSRRLLVF